MVAIMAERPKAKVKEDRSNRKGAPVQIDKELARMAAFVALHDGMTISELLSPQLEKFIRLNYARVVQSMNAGLKAPERAREGQ